MSANERFMVVAFTEPQPERRLFAAWPQHLTILPWLEGYRLQASNRIADALAAFEPLEITIEGEADFSRGRVPVWTVAAQPELQALHEAVLEAGPKHGTTLVAASHTGDNYKPHITKKAGQPARQVGERLTLREVSIIGQHATGKTVFRNITL